MLNQSKRNIRFKLNDQTNNNYQRLEYHQNTYFDTYKVKIRSTIFESTQAVVKIGLAKNTRQVRDRCRSKKWTTWILIKKGSNDYSLKKKDNKCKTGTFLTKHRCCAFYVYCF